MSINRYASDILNGLSVQLRRDGHSEAADVLKQASQLVRRAALPGNEDKLAEIAASVNDKLAGPEPEELVPDDFADDGEPCEAAPVQGDLFEDLDEITSDESTS